MKEEEEEKVVHRKNELPLRCDLLEGPLLVVVDGVAGHEGQLIRLRVQRHTLPNALVEHHVVLLYGRVSV